jgi:DeoR C terminal sensor domain
MKIDRASAIRQHRFAKGYSSIAEIAAAVGASEPICLPVQRAISEVAYQLLRPETSVFLDAWTTVLQLAQRLRLNPMSLRLFTNCLPVAQFLMPVTDISVTLLGGTLRSDNASMVGMLAEAALDRLWFDQLFLGVQRFGKPIRFTSNYGRKAFRFFQWVRGTPLERIRMMVGHSPYSRATEQNDLHIPNDSVVGAVLDVNILAADMKRKWQQMVPTERPPEGGLV